MSLIAFHELYKELDEQCMLYNKNLEAMCKIKAALEVLKKISEYPRGGLVVEGESSGDRDTMIELARKALR